MGIAHTYVFHHPFFIRPTVSVLWACMLITCERYKIWTLILDWCVVGGESKNKHHKRHMFITYCTTFLHLTDYFTLNNEHKWEKTYVYSQGINKHVFSTFM